MPKQYDRPYFDRWYRHPRHRVKSPLVLERKVRMVVAIAEHHLGHALGSVLDVGCGEAAWLAPLRKLRPRARYLGLDSSNYVVARYGRARNVRHCAFGQLAQQRFDGPVDRLTANGGVNYALGRVQETASGSLPKVGKAIGDRANEARQLLIEMLC
jgi:SAM-dependent methyltransferase